MKQHIFSQTIVYFLRHSKYRSQNSNVINKLLCQPKIVWSPNILVLERDSGAITPA